MSATTTERPEAPPSATEPPRKRRWWLGVIALFVVAMVGSSLVYLVQIEPLSIDASGPFKGSYREGMPFSYAVWIENDGRLPVKVTQVDGQTMFAGMLRTTSIEISRSTELTYFGTDPKFYQPFQSFTIPPGEGRGILVRNVFFGCRNWSKDTAMIIEAVGIHFSVVGVPRSSSLDLLHPITIRSPDVCPGRA